MKLSVIIPIYNTAADFVFECLSTCVNKGYEVIVIDDGSSLDYSNIFNKFKSIKYVKTSNKGLSAARNLGMLLATGEYIFFLDSDDMILEDGVNTMLSKASNNEIVLSKIYINENAKISGNYSFYSKSFQVVDKEELVRSIFLLGQKFTCVDTVWAKLYNRSFLEKNNIKFNTNLKNGEDILFNYECYMRANNIYFCNDYSYVYRVNDLSVCRSYVEDLDLRFITFIREFNLFFEKNNIDEPLFKEHVFRVVRRLFRKYYHYCDNYEDFCNIIKNIFNEDIIMDCLSEIDGKEMNNDKKLLLRTLNNRNIDELYNISRNARIMDLK